MTTSDERFYAQRDANFKERVYNILFDNPSGHSEQEALELINNLSKGLPLKVITTDETVSDSYGSKVDRLVDSMGS
jgi:hypothetical protein